MSTPETQTRTQFTRESIIDDYRIAVRSRHASLIGRKEVITGKAKFGIFGDGKELAQLAMARAARAGDIRSGYYRDQTFMMAVGEPPPRALAAAPPRWPVERRRPRAQAARARSGAPRGP